MRRTQVQLAAEREKYADLYNFAPAAYFTFDKNGVILELNLNAADLLGHARKYLSNHPITPYLTTDSLLTFVQYVKQALSTQRPQTCEVTIRPRHHELITVHVDSISVKGDEGELFVRSVMSDITEGKRTEEKLRESKERFRTLVNSIDDVIYTLDAHQRHTGVYGRWVENVGLTSEYFLGKTAREIFGPEVSKNHEEANSQALAGNTVVYEWSTEVGVSFFL